MALPSIDDLLPLTQQRTLRFPKPLEAAFQDFYFHNFLGTNRLGLIVGLIMWSLFGIIDLYAMPLNYTQTWVIRFGFVAPIIILVIVASFLPFYSRWMRLSTALITLTSALGTIAMVRLATPGEMGYYYYIYGLTVILVFLYTFPGAQFWISLGITLAILLAAPLAYTARFDFLANPVSRITFGLLLAFLITLGVVGLIGNYFYELSVRRNFIQRLIIEKEEERSNRLLLNVLPAPIAERLKRGEAAADFYPAISVLFADIVSFTPLSAGLPPAEVVHLLNHVFSTFDELTEMCTLEKIKTIGDAYMVVSGMPVPRPDHARALADLALEMQEAVAGLALPEAENLQVRIGMHTGPVVAGVIGWRKFAYDLWGDTVNIASRMESHGLPGKIQVSEAFYQLLKDQYIFEERGEIDVKGKGMMKAYLLVERKMAENHIA